MNENARHDTIWWVRFVSLIQGGVIAIGLGNAFQGTNWAMRSNGGFWVIHFGVSAVLVLLWLGLYALATSDGSRYLRPFLPLRGRWAGYAVKGILWLLGLMAFFVVALMPVA